MNVSSVLSDTVSALDLSVGLLGVQLTFVWSFLTGVSHTRVDSPCQVPRFMTNTCLLDYDSIAGADKFGNIFVLRVPADVSDDVDNPTGTDVFSPRQFARSEAPER